MEIKIFKERRVIQPDLNLRQLGLARRKFTGGNMLHLSEIHHQKKR